MKKFLLSICLCVTTALLASAMAQACDPRPGCGVVPAKPQTSVRPVPAPVTPPANSAGGNGAGDEVIWDLPAAEKQRIKKAVLAREAIAPQGQPQPAPGPTPPVYPSADEVRQANAIAAHKALTAQLARLTAKRAEIQRWDSQAQEKFRQAFGSTDEQLRKAVLQRIDQQIQESSRLLAALADNIRFDFYVSRDKRQ
jgi:hypothetical protein